MKYSSLVQSFRFVNLRKYVIFLLCAWIVECANDIYYIADNKFWYADRTFEAPAFRAWFETPKSADSRLRVFSISESDGATGINVIEHPNGSVDVMFDLSGKKMPAARRGINIINGKKVVKP